MPWLAIPYVDRERKLKLSQKFGVTGQTRVQLYHIRHFGLLDKNFVDTAELLNVFYVHVTVEAQRKFLSILSSMLMWEPAATG